MGNCGGKRAAADTEDAIEDPRERERREQLVRDLKDAVQMGAVRTVESILKMDVPSVDGSAVKPVFPMDLVETGAVHSAARLNRVDIMKLFLERCDVSPDAVGPMNVSLLSAAAACGQRDLMKVLIDAGADTDLGDYLGRQPIHVCCTQSSIAAVQLLLETLLTKRGRNAEHALGVVNQDGDNCFHYMARTGEKLVPLVEFLRANMAEKAFNRLRDARNAAGRSSLDECADLTIQKAFKPKTFHAGPVR